MSETNSKKPGIFANPIVQSASIIVIGIIIAVGLLYWQSSTSEVQIANSAISAPEINLSPTVANTLQAVYVNEGDQIPANTVVAEVGNELLKSTINGLVVTVNNQIGTVFQPGQTVVTMIDPNQLRIVGQLDENKGLDRIQVGQAANFTVDAFGSKVYHGVVDEISPTAQAAGAAFNISDQRQTQIFDVKVRFDTTQYPELKNGMSAKITVYTK